MMSYGFSLAILSRTLALSLGSSRLKDCLCRFGPKSNALPVSSPRVRTVVHTHTSISSPLPAIAP